MPEYAQVLGDAVRSARKSLGLTQSEAADRANIDGRTILNIENYRGNPQMEILYPLIRALKIDPTAIFYPEANRESESVTQFQIFLSQCSDEEMRLLLPVCETVLSVFRSRQSIPVVDE